MFLEITLGKVYYGDRVRITYYFLNFLNNTQIDKDSDDWLQDKHLYRPNILDTN